MRTPFTKNQTASTHKAKAFRFTPAVLALLLTSIPLLGCAEKQVPLKTGEQLYDYYCKSCHEKKGAGAYLENIAPEKRKMQTYQIILMIRYNQAGRHPIVQLNQLSDEQADLIAEFAVQLNR